MKLKTRTNQPVYYKLPVSSDIQHMSDDLLNSLRVGDVVQKKTGNQKHCYIVTYKEEKHGICLTYVDCGYMETISYDYTDGHWVFNSKDVNEVASKSDTNLENIEDKDGHKRFIEGEIEIPETEGITKSYGKWSLSGSHLLIVLGLEIDNGTSLTNSQDLSSSIEMPKWIIDKIFPVFGGIVIEYKSGALRDDSWGAQTINYFLQKTAQGNVKITSGSAVTLTAARKTRLSFDLLIDNE